MNSSYHSILRISVVVIAIVLVFQSGLLGKSAAFLTNDTIHYVAAVAKMTAAVDSTELNKQTTALTIKETELKQREEVVKHRELELGINKENSLNGSIDYSDKRITLILVVILFILLLLIIMNYIADYGKFKRLLNELESLKAGKEHFG